MADMRKCIGSTRFGIEAHEAPIGDFPSQPSQKDGLGRMCKPHWNQYTAGLARERKARLATEAAVTGEGPMPPAGSVAAARKGRAPKPEAIKVHKAKAIIAAAERLAGTAYTDAIGSDEVQAALEVIGEAQEPPILA